MDKLLKGFTSLGTKTKSKLQDLVGGESEITKTPDIRNANSTMAVLLAPKVQPETPDQKLARELKKKQTDDMIRASVEKQTKALREFDPGKTALNLAKEVAKGFARFGVSAGESIAQVPLGINELINPGTKLKVPIYKPEPIPGLGFLGPIESYQNEVKRGIEQEGQSPLAAVGKAALNVAVDEPVGFAMKPLAFAFGAFMKGGGDKAVVEAIDSMVKATDPKEVEVILGKFGIGDTAAKELAEPLAKATTKQEVESILGLSTKETKAAAKTSQKAPKATKKGVETIAEDGPVYLHGTNNGDAILKEGFKMDKAGSGSGYKGIMGTGIYLDTNPSGELAAAYGKDVLSVRPKKGIKLYQWKGGLDDFYSKAETQYGDPELITKYMQEQGYDGIEGVGQMVVFDPKNLEVLGKKGAGTGELARGAKATVARETAEGADQYVYHTTSPKNLESIKRNGLKPSEGQYGKGVYFAPTEAKTGGYGSSEGLMIRTDRSKLPKDFQEWPGEQGWTEQRVPASALEYKTSDGSWKPLVTAEEGAAKKSVLTPGFDKDKFMEGQVRKYKNHQNYTANKYNGFAKASGLDRAGFDDETIRWIDEWLEAKPSVPSENVIQRLEGTKPKKPVTLYSGNSIDQLKLDRVEPTSFTSDLDVAKQFGSAGRRDNPAIIRIKNVRPADIAVSIDNLPKDVLKALGHDVSFAATERELVTGNTLADFAKKYEIEISKDGGKTWEKMTQGSVAEEAPRMKSIGEIMQGGKGGEIPPAVRTAEAGAEGGATRRFIQRTEAMAPQMGPLLEGKYTPKSNQVLIETADKMIAENYAAAEQLARTGTNDQAVAVASKMIEDSIVAAEKATDELTKNAMYQKAADIANDAAKNLTEAGRTVQAASLLGKMTPEGMARYAAGVIQKHNAKAGEGLMGRFFKGGKVPELSKDQIKEITDAMTRINGMTDDLAKARELQKLNNTISKFVPSSLYDKIVNVWKAGLLTGLKTTGVNVASNFTHALSEVAKDVPASLVDKLTSLFTGERTLKFTGKGSFKGAAEGVAKGWDFFRTGFDERNIADKLDFRKVNFGESKLGRALEGYTETVFGLLGAEDQPFYYAAKSRSLANQAAAKAANEGLSGKAAREFAQNLIEHPTDDMLKYATLDAETAVFQQDSLLARKGKKAQQVLGQIILPFAKTPANVAEAMINYSPVGIVKTIIENAGRGKFDQRLFSQGIGRGITGTGALAIGSALLGAGLLSLSTPTSEKERNQWEAEGRTPNSIKIGDKWRSVNVLGPLGLVVVLGGHLQDGMDKTGSFTGGLSQVAAGFGSALTEQTFLSGVNKAIEAVKDPTRSFEGFASSLAGSIVPTLIADIARGTDSLERRNVGPMQRIESRVPGLRKNLEPQVDTFGGEKTTPNFFEVMADPTRPGNASQDKKDPVVLELRRLMDAGYPVTPTKLGDKDGYDSLTPEENTYLWQLAGQAAKAEIEKLMKSRAYARYDDELRSQAIDNAVNNAKVEARARVVVQALSGLGEEEAAAKLAEMKEEKLLTRQVFDLYLSLKRKQ